MTIGSLFGGTRPTTPSILDRFDQSSGYQFQASTFTPYVDRGGHEPEWPKSKSDSKNKTAMSALTLLAFLFFLNMLMSCLKDTIANNEPEVVIMQQRAARKARALEEHFRPKGDLGDLGDDVEEIDMDDYEAAGDYEPHLEGDPTEKSMAGKANQDEGGKNVEDFDVGNVIDNSVDTQDLDNSGIGEISIENHGMDHLSSDDHLKERGDDWSEESKYETSLETPETSEINKAVRGEKEEDEGVGVKFGREIANESGPTDIAGSLSSKQRRVKVKGSVWREAMAVMARSFIRRTYDLSTCKDLIACETTRIAGLLGKSSVAEGFGDMLDWLYDQSEAPQSWLDAVSEGRHHKTCQHYINKCTAETRGVSVLPVVAFVIEHFLSY